MSTGIRVCRCGNKSGKTYIPELTSKKCCSECFSPIPEPPERKKEEVVLVFRESNNAYSAVKITGERKEIIKSFNKKSDDYAKTNCLNFIRVNQ